VVLLDRTFRAKLVQQETAEQNVGTIEYQDVSARNDERVSSKSNVAATASQSEREDSELKKQQHFSKLFLVPYLLFSDLAATTIFLLKRVFVKL